VLVQVPTTVNVLNAQPRALWWLQTAFLLSLLGPTLLLVYVGWVSHAEAIEAARGRTSRLAQIVQEQSQRIVETNEVISRAILTRFATNSNEQLRAEARLVHAQLNAWSADLPQLQGVWLWDETGHPIATNLRPDPPPALDVSDREYFKWAAATTSAGWYVSAPLRSRTTGDLFFDFVKRRSDANGKFQGAISVSLLTSYFDTYFHEQLVNEPGFTLSLVRADGTYISRHPVPDVAVPPKLGDSSRLVAEMSARSPTGELQGPSTFDGQFRYVAFRRIGELPLYAVASATRSVVLEPWRKAIAILAAFTLPLALGLAALCWFAMRRVRGEHANAIALREQYEQRLKAEEGLRQAQKMEALGRLTGGVAHDFNNILMVVQTSLTLARQLEARGQPVAKALGPIERAIANGAQLTRQLMAVVRRQPLQVSTFRLNELIPSVADLMASTLGRGIEVSHEVSRQLTVTLDQAELELALINLCINAKDAMPGGGRLRIEARESQPPAGFPPKGQWACISVSDTGEGIAPEVLSRITEPFFTTKPLGKGTGLGMSQVQSFASQAGGQLEIASDLGQGTVVSIFLPCTIAITPAETAAAPALKPVQGNVLLVEDNIDIGEAVTAILQHAGAKVRWYRSADEALRAVAGGLQVDAVLSDVSLPGANNGIDLARQLASTRPDLRVVLMTGYTDRLQEAVAAGFHVVPKPASADTLIRAITEAGERAGSGKASQLLNRGGMPHHF
jgi:signal transduction histidine kinase/CheY-like chemotaxis protein